MFRVVDLRRGGGPDCRRIVAEREAGTTCQAVADRLGAEGIPSPSGAGRWNASRVSEVTHIATQMIVGKRRYRVAFGNDSHQSVRECEHHTVFCMNYIVIFRRSVSFIVTDPCHDDEALR